MDLAKDVALVGSTVIPGGVAVKGGAAVAKLVKAAKVAEEAGDASKAVRLAKEAEDAAHEARRVSEAAKAAKKGSAARRAGRQVNRAERKASRTRVRSERAGMSRGARNKDRVEDIVTRVKARAMTSTHKALVGGGAAGGVGAREIAKDASSKRAAAGALAREGSKRIAKAPGKAAGSAGRIAVAPAAAPVTAVVPANEKVQNAAQLPVQLGKATVEAPGKVAQQSLESGKEMLLGAPKAVYEMATNPSEAASMMIEDYKRRYGPLLEGDMEEFRKRVQDEGGLTPFALDALAVVPPAGRVAGSAARSGALGKRARRFMTADRPALLREAGQVAKRQQVSKNLAGVAAQRAADRIRARRTRARSEGRRGEGEAFAREAMERGGTVAPVFSKSIQAKQVATRKARTRLTNMSQQGRALQMTGRLIGGMSREQKVGLKWALALGIRSPEHARRELPRRIAAIEANRAGKSVAYGKLDSIPEIQRVIENADEIFTPEFARQVDTLRRVEKRLAVGDPSKSDRRLDPALDIDQATLRREAQQAEHLIGRRSPDEPMDEYRARYQEAARVAGLAAPGYFPSELSRRRRFSQTAVGGRRHAERVKKYEGGLFREGIENNDPAVMVRGFQRNVKRKNSWHMVSEIFERNSLPWSRDVRGHGMTQRQVIEELNRRGIDESSVTLVNPGLVRREANKDMMPGQHQDSGSLGLANEHYDELQGAIRKASDAADSPDFEDMRGWYAVPNQVMDELESSMKVGKLGRAADVAMSKMSGYLLAGNTGWLGFQTLSTAAQAMIGGVGPSTWLMAQLMWHRLKQEEAASGSRALLPWQRQPESSRQVVGNEDLGRLNSAAGLSQAQDFQQPPSMGATITTDTRLIGGAVEAARVFREGKWGQAIRRNNPIQLWFRISQLPENANRRAMAYRLLKSEAVKRMNQDVGRVQAGINKVATIMTMDPDKQIRALIKDPDVLDDMGQGLADFLGDYNSFTARERSVFKRSIPFYSWMRFATKFALFTLPKKHPTATALTYQLGRLESKELREVLGPGMGWALGKMFLGDPKDPNTPFVDVYRGNPLLSSLTDFSDERDIMGFVPPYIAIIGNAIYGRDYFTRQDITVDGETQQRRFLTPGPGNIAQIAIAQFLRTFTPYRQFEEIQNAGTPMSSDSFPVQTPFGGPQPKLYAPGSGSNTREREEAEFRDQGGATGVLYRRNLPFFPQDSGPLREQAKYINAERATELEGIEKRKREATGSGGGGAQVIVDRIIERTSSNSPAQEIVDRILERTGQ